MARAVCAAAAAAGSLDDTTAAARAAGLSAAAGSAHAAASSTSTASARVAAAAATDAAAATTAAAAAAATVAAAEVTAAASVDAQELGSAAWRIATVVAAGAAVAARQRAITSARTRARRTRPNRAATTAYRCDHARCAPSCSLRLTDCLGANARVTSALQAGVRPQPEAQGCTPADRAARALVRRRPAARRLPSSSAGGRPRWYRRFPAAAPGPRAQLQWEAHGSRGRPVAVTHRRQTAALSRLGPWPARTRHDNWSGGASGEVCWDASWHGGSGASGHGCSDAPRHAA
mmetsp:Transcript_10902/g.33602  ORF Transcript_10902/g.33602 Transcript_10902/m.33602 type:complete len:290 (+) Transcript_10902:1825-2694(+)